MTTTRAHVYRAAVLGLMIAAFASGCGDDNNDAPPNTQPGTQPPVEGLDFSGNYRFSQIECYDAEGEAVAIGTMVGYAQTVNISGNTITLTDTGESCTATTTGRVVFGSDDRATFSEGRVSVPSGSCTISTNLDVMTADDNDGPPSEPLTLEYTDGETEETSTVAYVRDEVTGALGIVPLQPISIPSQGDAACFAVYERA